MRRTKIICTIGPASDDSRHLLGLVENGMDIARLNLSHGSRDEHAKRIKQLREFALKQDRILGLLCDIQGPKIRTGFFKEGRAHLHEGGKVTITAEQVQGTNDLIPVDYPKFAELVSPGQQIYLADGMLELRAEEVKGKQVECKVVIGGELGNRKGVNLPGVDVSLPVLSEKDKADVEFAVEQKADFVAQSFVRDARDVLEMRKLLERHGSDAWIVAKIENSAAFNNIDEIIAVSDAVMVARGDLGVQLPAEDIPMVQKSIVAKCNAAAKPVIIATQMLESMVHQPQPTRAEVSDIANAIIDGACAVMLSAETANGKHPVRALEVMDKVVRKAEATVMRYERMKEFDGLGGVLTMSQSVSKSVCYTARDLRANAIATYTHTGHTGRYIAMYRPFTPVIAATSSEAVLRRLSLVWGVQPALIKEPKTTDELIERCVECAENKHLAGKGDMVVVAAGVPVQKPGSTNLIKIQIV